MNEESITLICLFHHMEGAEAAREDVVAAGIPEEDVALIARDCPGSTSSLSVLNELDLPASDLHRLLNGLEHGDVLLTVRAAADFEARVEAVFQYHEADLVAESGPDPERDERRPRSAVSEQEGMGLPVLQERLEIGRRTVTGGARVFQRLVKVPVGKQVNLRDENVRVDRRPVDRAATAEDSALAGEQVFELIETREQLVVGKTARVVEEIVVGREVSQRVEHIRETLRHTEVQVEQIVPNGSEARSRQEVPERT